MNKKKIESDKNIVNDELNKSTPEEVEKAYRHATTPLDYDYQDHDSYEQPFRNSQRGYAPIDAPKPELSHEDDNK